MARYEPIKFPGWRYGPKGEAQIFEREEDVPQGWTDNPNDFKSDSLDESIRDVMLNGTQDDGVVDETGADIPSTDSPAATEEAPLTDQEIDEGLQNKSMGELWKMAKDLKISKEGKKPELIKRIKAKLSEIQY